MAETPIINTASQAQRLTIRVTRHTLSFSVADASAECQVAYHPYTVKSGMSIAANLREAFKSDDWLNTGWRHAIIMIDTPVLMIPAEAFSSSTSATLYNHAFNDVRGDAVMHTVLPQLGAVALFGVNKDLRLVVADNFQDAKFIPLCSPVWNHLYHRSFTGPRQKLFGYWHDKKLDVFSFRQNRFRFCNTFDTNNSRDTVFFLLYVWKQTGMDQQHDELHIVGNVPEMEETFDMLRRYVRNVHVINPTADFNRSPVTRIKGMPYDLMTLYIKGR